MELTQELKEFLVQAGAKLVGVGDLSGLGQDYPRGIAVALPLPKQVLQDLQTAPTREYYQVYQKLNETLDRIITQGEQFLREKGFRAYAQTTSRVRVDGNKRSPLPHKTVATRAGLGWIGKNCLLVTPQYGAGVRLSSLLTDAPLDCSAPVEHSLCGSCNLCVESCPGKALKGALWKKGMERRQLLDVQQCYQTQVAVMTKHTGIQTDQCGKCFAVCAYTQRYLKQKND